MNVLRGYYGLRVDMPPHQINVLQIIALQKGIFELTSIRCF